MGMNLSLKVRHPKCVNNYVYYTSPCGKALQRYNKIRYPANLFYKKSLLPRNLILIKKESVSESWHTLEYEGLIGGIISYLVFALNDYFLSQLSPRTIISYLTLLLERLLLPAVKYLGAIYIVLVGIMEWRPQLSEEWVLACHFIPLPWTGVRLSSIRVRHAFFTPVTA